MHFSSLLLFSIMNHSMRFTCVTPDVLEEEVEYIRWEDFIDIQYDEVYIGVNGQTAGIKHEVELTRKDFSNLTFVEVCSEQDD